MILPSRRPSLPFGLLLALAAAAGLTHSLPAVAVDATSTIDAPARPTPVLTREQKDAALRVEGMLIAPCCFGGTVADHRSPLSDSIRANVRGMIAAGVAEEEILARFESEYGERILAAPRAEGFNLLAYVLPFVVVAVGAVVILAFAVRGRYREDGGRVVELERGARTSSSENADDDGRDERRRRLEAELARLNG